MRHNVRYQRFCALPVASKFKTLVWNVWSNQRSIKNIIYLDTLVTLTISKFGDSFGVLLTAIWRKNYGLQIGLSWRDHTQWQI